MIDPPVYHCDVQTCDNTEPGFPQDWTSFDYTAEDQQERIAHLCPCCSETFSWTKKTVAEFLNGDSVDTPRIISGESLWTRTIHIGFGNALSKPFTLKQEVQGNRYKTLIYTSRGYVGTIEQDANGLYGHSGLFLYDDLDTALLDLVRDFVKTLEGKQ